MNITRCEYFFKVFLWKLLPNLNEIHAGTDYTINQKFASKLA